MFPILFEFRDIVLPSWHVFYALAALASFLQLRFLTKRYTLNLNPIDLSNTFAICYTGGYFGARLLSIAIEEREIWSQGFLAVVKALVALGPMTFYGGFITAVLFGVLYAKIKKISVYDLADAGLPAGLMGLAIGRIGCFLNGDDYGKEVFLSTSSAHPWWAVSFPNLGDGIYRYPVQLMESLLVSVLVLAVSIFFKPIRGSYGPGSVAWLSAIGYANLRLILEFLRDDFRGVIPSTSLSTSQFISLIILVLGAIVAVYRLKCLSRTKA